MNNKDKQITEYIKKHYDGINKSLAVISDNYEKYEKDSIIQKAISFDLFQIGELFNSLSENTRLMLNKKDVRGIIDVRNYIAHGYIYIKNTEIWNTIHNDLPRLVNQLFSNINEL